MKVLSSRYLLVFALLALFACNRDPNYVKQQYLQSGNKYFERGRYKEALIMYRKALAKDQKYGDAYYRMALTSLKMGQVATAAGPLRRAVELLPPGTPDADDANVKLGEILLRVAEDIDVPGKNKALVDEAEQMKAGMLARNPNSFGGNKLAADILLVQASDAYRRSEKDKAKDLVLQASEQYRKTLALQPGDLGVRMALARTLAMSEKYPQAEELYRQAIAKSPSDAAGYRELYQLLMLQKRTPDAEQLLKDATSRNVADQNFELMLAGHYFSQNDKVRMKQMLDKIESQFKENATAYFTVGDFYLRIGDASEAIRQYQAGIQHDAPHKTEYEKRVIDVMIRQGKVNEAYDKNLELLKESPKDPDARGIKASFMLDKGDVNQALAELQAVVTAKPENFVARFNLGRAHYAKGQFEQALQQFGESVKLRPDYIRPRLAMTQVALIQGNFDQALRWAQETEKYSPNNPSARLMEAAALMRLNRVPEARAILDALNKANPGQPDILLELAVVDLAEKKLPDAAATFHAAFVANPGNIKGLMGEAQSYYMANQPQKALQVIQDAVAKYPARADIYRELAGAHARLNQYDLAMQELQQLLTKFKLNPREQSNAYAAMGEIYVHNNDLPKAIEYLEKGRALGPDNVTLLNYLAQTYNRAGQREQARRVFQDALAKDPSNPATMNNLAFLMADLGTDLDQALTLANRAKQRLPNLVEVSDTIGWIYLKKNLSDSATDIFRDLNAKVPNNATFRLHYCMALAQKGDKAGATRECHTAMDLKPSKEDLDQIKQVLAKVG